MQKSSTTRRRGSASEGAAVRGELLAPQNGDAADGAGRDPDGDRANASLCLKSGPVGRLWVLTSIVHVQQDSQRLLV